MFTFKPEARVPAIRSTLVGFLLLDLPPPARSSIPDALLFCRTAPATVVVRGRAESAHEHLVDAPPQPAFGAGRRPCLPAALLPGNSDAEPFSEFSHFPHSLVVGVATRLPPRTANSWVSPSLFPQSVILQNSPRRQGFTSVAKTCAPWITRAVPQLPSYEEKGACANCLRKKGNFMVEEMERHLTVGVIARIRKPILGHGSQAIHE